MSIRIPQKADTDTQSAFQDVEKALAELSARLDQVTELEQKVKELSIVSDTPRPSFITQGDTVIEGDLRVEGGLAVRGDVDAPHALDGLVVATPEGIGSSAQRVVEVHGSLAVLSALSAENIRTRNLQVYGTVTAPGLTVSGVATRLSTDVTDVGNVGTGEDTLMTYTVPANTLASDGQALRITVWGTTANNTSARTIKLHFGATSVTIFTYGTTATMQNTIWEFTGHLVRTSATTQALFAMGKAYGLGSGNVLLQGVAEAAPGETLSGSVVLKVTGESVNNDDIVQKAMIVELLS